MDSVISIVKELFSDPTPKKWRTAAFLVIVGMVVATIAEVSTGFRFLWAMDRKVELLEKLNALSQTGIDKNPQLNTIYQDLSTKLNNYSVEPLSIVLSTTNDPFGTVIMFLSATWLWIFVLIAVPFMRKRVNNWPVIFIFALILIALFGTLAIVLPTVGNYWINSLLYILLNIGIIRLISMYSTTSNKANVTNTA